MIIWEIVIMDFTKGLICPGCGEHTGFKGGQVGGGLNYTNVSCDCGFTAWVIITQKDYEYSVYRKRKDDTEAQIRKYSIYDDTQLLELQIKYKMAYDMIDSVVRPEGMYEVYLEIGKELERRSKKLIA
jgi:cephalosporin-C deacetylase-like acetyl esterase